MPPGALYQDLDGPMPQMGAARTNTLRSLSPGAQQKAGQSGNQQYLQQHPGMWNSQGPIGGAGPGQGPSAYDQELARRDRMTSGLFGKPMHGAGNYNDPSNAPAGSPGAAPPGGQSKVLAGWHSANPASGIGGGGALSDERSKQRISELEDTKRHYEDLLDTDTAAPDVRQPDTASLDSAYRKPGDYTYEYKPEFRGQPGAGDGRYAGPMAHELKGIPGVVKPGANGMDHVDTPRLTMANTSQVANLTRGKADRSELEELRQRVADLSDSGDSEGVLRAAQGGR